MKKILYLHAGAEMYGADKVLLDLIKGLDKERFEAHVILPNQGLLVSELEKVGAIVSVLPYPILRRKYFTPKGIFHYFKDYFSYSKELASYAKLQKIDLIHNNTTAVFEGMYLAKKANIPLIWHIHEIILKPRFIFHIMSYLISRKSTKVVAVSNAVKNHFESSRFWKQKQTIDVIYNGVDSEIYHPYSEDVRQKLKEQFGIPAHSKVLGMVGRVNAWKGQTDFLQAVETLLKEDATLHAVMVGGVFEGEEWRMEELLAAVESSPISKQITVKDFDPNTVDLYNLFDVFVLPSTNPDPLPTVVLEAMACGKPIVAYRHGGVTEMVVENYNGQFAEVKNPQDLSEKIKEVLEDSARLEQYSQHSRNRQVEAFSLKAYVERFSKLYGDYS